MVHCGIKGEDRDGELFPSNFPNFVNVLARFSLDIGA